VQVCKGHKCVCDLSWEIRLQKCSGTARVNKIIQLYNVYSAVIMAEPQQKFIW